MQTQKHSSLRVQANQGDNGGMKQERKRQVTQHRKALPSAQKKTPDTTPVASPSTRKPLPISESEDGQLIISEAGFTKMAKTFLGSNAYASLNGEDTAHLESTFLGAVAGALPYSKGRCGAAEGLNFALDAVATLAPRDGLEVMLCSQMVALHGQSMEFMRRGMLPDQTNDGVDRNVNRATRLLRTFATLAECLRTHRGGGQQKVTVEHVTVQAGGQAIMGTVNRGVGGGDAQENGE